MIVDRTFSRTGLVLLLGLTVFVMIAANDRPVAAGKPGDVSALQGNLLQNPGFEGRFRAWSGIPEVQVAANWTPWWWEDPDHNPAYFRPEYKRALASVFPKRVLGGESAQQWFTFHASHIAGMYQQVFNVTPGQRYRFSIWAQVWSSSEDNPNESILPANPHLQIGLDPTGNWNPGAGTVIWSGEAPMSGIIDQWGLMAIEAPAENDVITVFMRTNPDFANKHNDMYWDNAGLEAVQPPQPTTPPSPTPGPATNTPEATVAPAATDTPAVTDTPEATATETRAPTATPTRVTPTASPTETSRPTNTATPVPTNTTQPTMTPTVTVTPAASPTSLAAETNDNGEAIANNQDQASDQQEGDSVEEPDSLGIVALVAIGVAISLLVVLVFMLVRRIRTRES